MQKFSDNGTALLMASIAPGDTSLTVEAAKADRFPVANTPNWAGTINDWFKVVLFDAAGNREVIRVGVRSASSGVMSNLLRGQEGTTALNFPAGSVALMTITAKDVENVLAGIFPSLDIAGALNIGAGLDIGTYFHCQQRAYTDVVQPLFAASLTLDASLGNVFELADLTANITAMTIANATPGQNIELVVKQSGAANFTVAGPAGSKISGSPALGVGRVSKLFMRKSARDGIFQGFWVPIAP